MDGDGRIIFQSKEWAIKTIFIILLIVFIFSTIFNQVLALTIYPGTEFEVENETYTVNQVMVFSSIVISDTYIIFNTTGFYIDSPNDITISLIFINSSIVQASNGDLVLNFYANTIGANVLFDISGFLPGYEYEVRRDGNPISYTIANSSGFISFSNNVWSNHEFRIYLGELGSDVISPELSDIVLSASNPLDTEAGFGWENITCIATDNVGVDEVKINIVYPDSSTSNISMNHITGTNNYYYYTTFSQPGNYSYYIWTQDTSANENISDTFVFTLPPNWDINSDGECNVLDLALVSNRYYETGNNGWIREDINNNGAISVLDLVLLSNHYDEIW